MSSSVRKPEQPKKNKSEGSSIPEKVISSLKRSLKIYKDAGLKANEIVGKTIRMASEVASPLGITNKQLRSEINKLMEGFVTGSLEFSPEKEKKASGGMIKKYSYGGRVAKSSAEKS